MTSQPGEQRITTHISQIKDNPTMKYGHLIEYPKWNVFFKNYADNEAGKQVSDRSLFFKKALY